MTAEKLEELKLELNNLKTVRRLEVADRLKRAKELGDLSENSEYVEARDEQQLVETRISELEETIKNAAIFEKTSGKAIVQIGSTVEVSKDDKNFRFTIVGPNESNPDTGLISNESPVGRALLGKKPGEIVQVKVPAGVVSYTVVRIE